jgi:hypothetical protein
MKFVTGQQPFLQNDQQPERQQLTQNDGDVLEARVKTATLRCRHFTEIGSRTAIFAANTESL